jgi:hypothetical protein
MPPQSGGKGGYGHRHQTQEELVIWSIRLEDARADGELVEDFWPA